MWPPWRTTPARKARSSRHRLISKPPTSRRRNRPPPTSKRAAAQAQAAAVPAVDPMTAQLENLANLHTQGILNDEEYAAAKAKALGI